MRTAVARTVLMVVALYMLGTQPAQAAKVGSVRLANPSIPNSSPPHPGPFGPLNVFDEDRTTHYASHNQGENTFMEFNFGAPVTITGFLHDNRSGHVLDQVLSSDLTFSSDGVFDAGDTVVSLTHTSQTVPAAYRFAPQTVQHVRWDVTGVDPGGQVGSGNQGAKEMAFLGVSGPMLQIGDPAITASATPYNGGFVATNVFANNAAAEYASQGQGANTLIDFDFGSPTRMSGFEFLDRAGVLDEIYYSRLTFSNDPSFTTPVGEFLIHHEGQAEEHLYAFPEQTARYVRWQVTETYDNVNTNAGAKEIGFYAAIPDGHVPLDAPTITGGATAFGNAMAPLWDTGGYRASNLFDGNPATEYASYTAGIVSAPLANDGTYLEFDFGETTIVAGLEHVDRLPFIDNIVRSTLYFSDDPTFDLSDASVTIRHGGAAAYETFAPVAARYVRWEVNEITPGNVDNVGGKEMVFYTIPEPSSVLLLLFGLAGIAMLGRRR